jgi:ribokinase
MPDTILVVGSLNMDQIVRVPRLPVFGETLLGAGSLKLVPGGKGANQAVAIARLLQHSTTDRSSREKSQSPPSPPAPANRAKAHEISFDRSGGITAGTRVMMAGCVGTDPFGSQLLQALQAEAIDTQLVAEDAEESSGTAFIFLSPHGDNAIVVSGGANMRVGHDTDHFQHIMQAMSKATTLVLQMEIPHQVVSRLIAEANTMGLHIVLNLAPAHQLPRDILRKVSVLVLNESEASLLSGQRVESVEDARIVATVLHGYGIPTIVITLGAHGALLITRDTHGQLLRIYQEAPKVQAIDTTAAGDCFVGALTVALAEKQPPEQALRFAINASALKVTRFGAQSGLPTRAEVLKAYPMHH